MEVKNNPCNLSLSEAQSVLTVFEIRPVCIGLMVVQSISPNAMLRKMYDLIAMVLMVISLRELSSSRARLGRVEGKLN